MQWNKPAGCFVFLILCPFATLFVMATTTTTSSAAFSSSALRQQKKHFNVAIIGGGITGSVAAHTLLRSKATKPICVHLFDQGRRGVGGRSSHRRQRHPKNDDIDVESSLKEMRWDHGCQFFRADTPRFQSFVKDLLLEGTVKEWKGNFISSGKDERDFFGMPSKPPFFVGGNGMQRVPQDILHRLGTSISQKKEDDNPHIQHDLSVFTGTRVAELERHEKSQKWTLFGTSGTAAYHDTPEKIAQQQSDGKFILGDSDGYDAIILTDVSSSFGKWHRASAGVPESFACRVRERVGARVPLFTSMITFSTKTDIPFDAATFDNDILWFASKSNSKPGMGGEELYECWTLVSTPEYAMEKIEETPMQDPETGEFIPQSKEYLTTVPGPDLKAAFCKELLSQDGILGKDALSSIPTTLHVDAQRWGSALPVSRLLDDDSKTRKIISGVAYDCGRSYLAPTKIVNCNHGDDKTYLVDEDLMLFQAGDMVSTFTPGFEGAAISGMDAVEHLLRKAIS